MHETNTHLRAGGTAGQLRRTSFSFMRLSVSAFLILSLSAQTVLADMAPGTLPTGGQVTSGAATINTSGNTMTVNQSTGKAAINWNKFSIGSDATVNFVQPSSSSVTLNRVTGSEKSVISGALNANGNVFLLNSNGVLMTGGARVDTGGFVAGAMGLSDENFKKGKYVFENTGSGGSVANEGAIKVRDGGYAVLVGNQVRNSGTITARLGTVALAAGDKVSLTFSGGGLANVVVDRGALDALVENKQAIYADGGQVIMTAQAANALVGTVVNNEGIIQARSISKKNGVIRLDGGDAGAVTVSGTLDASGLNTGEKGGTVQVLGHDVTLKSGTVIDASGDKGGGTVLVGGDFQGANAKIRNAANTKVQSGATIKVDAVRKGNGGKAIIWADNATDFRGEVTAKGGAASGNGGFVEVSGKEYLNYKGKVDTTAAKGKIGTLLLDPADIVIMDGTGDGAADGTGTFAGDPAGVPGTVTSGQTGPTIIYESELEGIGATTSVNLHATNSIIINDLVTDGTLSMARSLLLTAGAGGVHMLNPSNTLSFVTGGLSVLTTNGGGVTLGNISMGIGDVVMDVSGGSVISGVISGTATTDLYKYGDGRLTLSGLNTYSGQTWIEGGILSINTIADGGVASSIGMSSNASGNLRINNSSILEYTGATASTNRNFSMLALTFGVFDVVNPATVLTVSGGVTGTSAGIAKQGAGTLRWETSNYGYGGLRIDAGTFRVASMMGAYNVTINGGVFDMNNYTLGLGTVTLNGGTITATAGTLSASAFNMNAGVLDVILTGNTVFNKATAGTVTLNKQNTYTAATNINEGTLLYATNDALGNGLININGGTLDIATYTDTVGAVTLNSGSIAGTSGVLTGGSYAVRSGSISAILGGSGNLTKTTAGTVTLSGLNTYTGQTLVNDGILSVSTLADAGVASNLGQTTNAANRLLLNGGILQYTGGTVSTNRGFTVGSGLTANIQVTNGASVLTIGGTSSASSGALQKTGAGELRLSGTHAYTGGTIVSAGVFSLGASNILSNAGAITIDGGQFNIGSYSDTVGTVNLVDGMILGTTGVLTGYSYNVWSGSVGAILAGTGTLTKDGSGLVTMFSQNTYTGLTTVLQGGLMYGTNNVFASGDILVNGGTLVMSDYSDTVGAVTLNSGSILGGLGSLTGTSYSMLDGNVSAVLAGTGNLTKTGSGTVTLSGLNTYTGSTTIYGGWLNVATLANGGVASNIGQSSNAASNLVFSGGTLRYTGGSVTIDRHFTMPDYQLTTVDVTNAATNLTLAGNSSAGLGYLQKSGPGTLTLSGVNGHTGVTFVVGGELVLMGGQAISDAGGVYLADIAGARLVLGADERIGSLTGGGANGGNVSIGAHHLTVGDATNVSYDGVISGTGSVTKEGTGTWTLSRSQSYSGDTNVNEGRLVLNGNFLLSSGNNMNVGVDGILDSSGYAQYFNSITNDGAVLLGSFGALQTFGGQTHNGTVTGHNAQLVTGGGDISAANAANDFTGTLLLQANGGDIDVRDANNINIASANGARVRIQAGGDITLSGVVQSSSASANAVELVAGGNFFELSGAAGISLSGGGNWQVYSTSPLLNNNGNLAANFKQYNASYGDAVLGTGNGFLYTLAPTVTVGIGGVSKTYNGSASINIADTDYVILGGAVDNDVVVMTDGLIGAFDTANAGTGKTVTVTGASIDSVSNNGVAVYGYQLDSTTVTGNTGAIDKAQLTVSTTDVTKPYDGTTVAAGSLIVTGGTLYANESNGNVMDSIGGGVFTFDDALPGVGKTVTVSGATVTDGNGGGNYDITYVSNTNSSITGTVPTPGGDIPDPVIGAVTDPAVIPVPQADVAAPGKDTAAAQLVTMNGQPYVLPEIEWIAVEAGDWSEVFIFEDDAGLFYEEVYGSYLSDDGDDDSIPPVTGTTKAASL